ncbi:hypothetical protein ACFQJD_13965 [Haloplanus sp. GCM10025708]|uniref:hypothetical protein n=1 Tax=Haloplanus sp. GCM10025708 TaxID=3252679 RepID=UPI00361D0C55
MTFTRLLVGGFLALAALDYVRVDMTATPVPFNYPYYVTLVHLPVAFVMLERYYDVLAEVRDELVHLAGGPSMERAYDLDVDVPDPEAVATAYDAVLNRAFHPLALGVGGVVGAGVMFALGVRVSLFAAYPHTLTLLALGAAHGLFLAPFLGTLVLASRMTSSFIQNVDSLDPDGVGGYRRIGDASVTLVVYGVVLMTFDFVTASSVTFVPGLDARIAVFGAYGVVLAVMIGLTLLTTHLIRSRLLTIRDRKLAIIRWNFRQAEQGFWTAHADGESTDEAALDVVAMATMYDQLAEMNMWPINVASAIKLAASVTTSLVVVGLDLGWLSIPV